MIEQLSPQVGLHSGDCIAFMELQPENSFDAIICDPPYHLTSIVKRFGGDNAAPVIAGKTGVYARSSTGFMGKSWDGGDIAFQVATWEAALRVLKPGGYLLAFGGTRTAHRMVCAIEDAGFEVRESLYWMYASGFPKSHNIGRKLDGEDRRCSCKPDLRTPQGPQSFEQLPDEFETLAGQPQSQERGAWPLCNRCGKPIVIDGLGTALKPAVEPICLARKPLSEKTIAANILKWGTGGVNIDACRVAHNETLVARFLNGKKGTSNGWARPYQRDTAEMVRRHEAAIDRANALGRWPANLLLDGSDCVIAGFPEVGPTGAGAIHSSGTKRVTMGKLQPHSFEGYGETTGSAARYFFSSKAGSQDRCGSLHPTIKPVSLMRWLVRLVTPPGGRILDPFAGSGTTGQAAALEGLSAVLCEMEPQYQADIRRRINMMKMGDDEKRVVAIKARGRADYHAGPLFGEMLA